MRVLDVDMDYFMTRVENNVPRYETKRLDESEYGSTVWSVRRIYDFLENNLGLSKERKVPGRIVTGHDEALYFWKELIEQGRLKKPFEVIHVDSHADLGCGGLEYGADNYIMEKMLALPVEERPKNSKYIDKRRNKWKDIDIGDYLLYAIAYRWIKRIDYCGNPCGESDDYLWYTLKDFHENHVGNKPVWNTIQLLYNPDEEVPIPKDLEDFEREKKEYLRKSKREPEVPLLIIPNVEDVHYNGDFDFAVLAQSPNYTPASADFIMDIFREYIEEI